MAETRPDPGALMKLATGFWDSAVLLTANELGVFTALADQALPATEVAARLQCAAESLQRLLDACAGLGLLAKEIREPASLYRNTPTSNTFLVQGRPGYLGEAIRWGAAQYPAWGHLSEATRSGQPVVSPTRHLGDDPQATRTFVLGMHNRALATAPGVLPYLDFGSASELLDVGGGPATYAMLLAGKYPQLHITTLDLPEVVAIAAELIAQAGLTARITTRPGNALTDEYGREAFDGVLFSGVLHQMNAPSIQGMLRRAWQALRPGGRIILSDIMLEESKTQPAFAALFSLQMLLTSEGGAVFSVSECVGYLESAGFAEVRAQTLPPPLPYVVVEATKR